MHGARTPFAAPILHPPGQGLSRAIPSSLAPKRGQASQQIAEFCGLAHRAVDAEALSTRAIHRTLGVKAGRGCPARREDRRSAKESGAIAVADTLPFDRTPLPRLGLHPEFDGWRSESGDDLLPGCAYPR